MAMGPKKGTLTRGMLKSMNDVTEQEALDMLNDSVEHTESESDSEVEGIMENPTGDNNNVLIPYFNDISKRLDKLTKSIEDPRMGLKAKLSQNIDHADDNTDRIAKLELENKVLQALVQR